MAGRPALRDRNGQVSRLLLLLTCYHLGIEAGIDLFRWTLKACKAAGRLECLGLGRNARWRRKLVTLNYLGNHVGNAASVPHPQRDVQ